jgi:hypothetical protein
MSSATLRDIIAKLPTERSTIERLERLLGEHRDRDYTAERLYRLVEPHSRKSLARVLFELVGHGLVDTYVTVESPSGGSIGEYESLDDVPAVVKDFRTGRSMRVSPEDLRVHYRWSNAGRNR